jgi:acyl-coenzyme A synthetase/AMP-(fatty) acid ligase
MTWDNISDAVFEHAEKRPDGIAVIDGGSTLTYGALARLVGKATVHLTDIGIAGGDKVAVGLVTSTDHLILSLALMRIGAVTVECHPYLPAQEHQNIVRKFGVGTFFYEADAEPPRGVGSQRIDVGWRALIERKQGDVRFEGSPDKLHSITLTSGSTGEPKGVITTHRQRIARYQGALRTFARIDAFSATNPAKFIVSAGFNFAGFFQFALNQLFAGGPLVLMPEFPRSADMLRVLASWDDTVSILTPTMLRAFLAAAPTHGVLLPRARALIALGLPLFADEKRAITEKITPHFYDHYGTTAFGVISCLHPEDMAKKAESVGRAAADTEVAVVDRRGQLLPFGETGHLRCRGPAMSEGFYGGEQGEGPEGFQEGWYYPGDLAAMDDQGYIFLKGRSADLITRRGLDIYPPELEQVLIRHPLVSEAAVVGRPVPGGEEVIAFIISRGGEQRHEEIAMHCRAWLAPEKQPDRIYYIESLPKTGAGKLDRPQLKALAVREAARQRGA